MKTQWVLIILLGAVLLAALYFFVFKKEIEVIGAEPAPAEPGVVIPAHEKIETTPPPVAGD
ncbi:MAG: hypothetical protein ISS18_15165 [Bacteroidales bacterium]|nr:hypothetical protein [Bacteroidales bacterium]